VLMKIVVAVWARTVGRDTLDFVTMALKQKPPGIFEGLEAKQVGRVRFWMDNEEAAKFKFDQKGKRFIHNELVQWGIHGTTQREGMLDLQRAETKKRTSSF
jgi:hypothetical protein